MRQKIEDLIEQTRNSIQFKQKWNAEHPDQINEMKMHFLDGRLETLEEVLKLIVAEE